MDAERPRRRRRRGRDEEEDGGYQGPDRISRLPNEVAHHISSLLPEEDLARTSTLSKRWKSIWRTLPAVNFDENRFRHLGDPQCRQEFLYSMSRLILSEDLDRALIKKIIVFAIHPHDAGLDLLTNLFIDLSISKSKLLELDITVDDENSYNYGECSKISYSLPNKVFETGTNLTALFLKFCSVGTCENVKFPCLKTMSLTFVLIPDEMLTNLITNSPNLEDLSFMYCFNVVVLRISNSNLRRLTVGTRGNLMLLEMEAPRLEMFDYHGIFPAHHSDIDEHAVQTSQIVEFSTPNRFGLESLKTLTMANFNSLKALELISNIYFESGIFNLTDVPCLETVVVSSCFLLRDFRLSSHSVNSLTMQSCFSLEEAAINFPNLRSSPTPAQCAIYRNITIESEGPESIIVPRTLQFRPAIRFIEEFVVSTFLPNEMTYLNFLFEVMSLAFCFKTFTIDMPSIQIRLKFGVPPNMAELASDRTQEMGQTHDCIMYHLVDMEIANFSGDVYGMELIQYLLEHSMTLENILSIGFRDFLPPIVTSSATITSLLFPRANPFAIIWFKTQISLFKIEEGS
ncbi:hypothetical protein TIFTF001_035694 [Ficus carica]|uniref:F-box domain-containing protein n=1 Tax=Ficus carica TaxID=3494 RepID=A0AA88E210_FICCA|nr:hypothetical protein TIFTF001_035694 [Ficus carica]